MLKLGIGNWDVKKLSKPHNDRKHVLGVGVKYWDKQGGMMSVQITQIGIFNPTSSNLHRRHAPCLSQYFTPTPSTIEGTRMKTER